MGYSDKSSHSEGNPFRSPTWEEIFDSRNFSDRPPPTDEQYKDFHMGGSFSYNMGGGEYEDSFSSVFGQMDDMFRQLDSIMQGFHGGGYPGQVIITESPDFEDSSDDQSPRESLLKKPDGGVPERGPSPRHRFPHFRSPFHGPVISDPEEEGSDFDENGQAGIGPGGFGGGRGGGDFQEFGMADPFQMMEEFFKSFGGGGGFGVIPFGEHPGVPMLPKPGGGGGESGENPRDSVVKKEDVDLDDRITGGFSDLLKDMPKYDPPVIPGQPSMTQPQPRVQHRYHSTSVVRIRRPDGSVEETRKYTDSTGREEVTVTHTQPEDGNPAGPLIRQDQGIFDGHNRPQPFLPSIFSWFYTR